MAQKLPLGGNRLLSVLSEFPQGKKAFPYPRRTQRRYFIEETLPRRNHHDRYKIPQYHHQRLPMRHPMSLPRSPHTLVEIMPRAEPRGAENVQRDNPRVVHQVRYLPPWLRHPVL